MALRTLPIRRVGNRHTLFLGGDRELVMVSGLAALTLLIISVDTVATIGSVSLWLAALTLTRLMAKKDPMLRHVYLRHRLYQAYYPARSTPFHRNTPKQARRYR